MQIKLTKPITIGDGDEKKTLDTVELKLESLTGGDVEFCVREASAGTGVPVLLYEYDLDFYALVVEKLTGISRKTLRDMPARDYKKLTGEVRTFFAGSE